MIARVVSDPSFVMPLIVGALIGTGLAYLRRRFGGSPAPGRVDKTVIAFAVVVGVLVALLAVRLLTS